MTMKQCLVHGRFSFDGQALVKAKDVGEAKTKFEAGDFEFFHDTASVYDWEVHKIECTE